MPRWSDAGYWNRGNAGIGAPEGASSTSAPQSYAPPPLAETYNNPQYQALLQQYNDVMSKNSGSGMWGIGTNFRDIVARRKAQQNLAAYERGPLYEGAIQNLVGGIGINTADDFGKWLQESGLRETLMAPAYAAANQIRESETNRLMGIGENLGFNADFQTKAAQDISESTLRPLVQAEANVTSQLMNFFVQSQNMDNQTALSAASLLAGIMTGREAMDYDKWKFLKQLEEQSGGSWLGSVLGTVTGGLLGAASGGIGTAVGGAIGSKVGGWISGSGDSGAGIGNPGGYWGQNFNVEANYGKSI